MSLASVLSFRSTYYKTFSSGSEDIDEVYIKNNIQDKPGTLKADLENKRSWMFLNQ